MYFEFVNKMFKCLLETITYSEYVTAKALPLERCEIIAKLANLKIMFNESKVPGELLIKHLDKSGCSAIKYREYLTTALNTKIIRTFHKPHSKLAILIANDKYQHLSRLATPSIDCDSLGSNLKTLGFVVVILKNTKSIDLRNALEKVLESTPENSYCFIFYAGHGCELCNTKCMLNIDCPAENITLEHCVTENYVLNAVAKCNPDLCVLIMDMCRIYLDRETNPSIYSSILSIEPTKIDSNLLISYSTQSSQSAYEIVEIELSTSIDSAVTYELKTGDSERIVPNASQYVNALCTRLADDLDVSALLDKVHADVENSMKKQRPIKVQCGSAKRSLYDPVTGDTACLLNKLREVCKDNKDYCNVF